MSNKYEERFSLCCNAPALGGKEEYGFCKDCEEQAEFLTEEEYLDYLYAEEDLKVFTEQENEE